MDKSKIDYNLIQTSDLSEFVNLLNKVNLTEKGLSKHLNTAVVARSGGEVLGGAVLELYDDSALLRSVAVRPNQQGKGTGHGLVDSAINLANEYHVHTLYLLTETASEFFPKFGFHRVDRSKIPAKVKTSIEFTEICPESAIAMVLKL